VAAWAGLALAGWLLRSVSLTALAPLLLLPLPVLLVRLRDGERWRPIDPFEPAWALTVLYAFTYLAVPALSAERPEAFTSLEGYFDTPPASWQAATWVAGLGFLALLYGYFGPLGDRLARALPVASGRDAVASGRDEETWVGMIAGFCFAGGTAAVAAAVVINDGLSLPLDELFTGGLRNATVTSFSGRGYLSLGFLLLALSIPCGVLWASARPSRRKWASVAAAAVLAEVLLGAIVASRVLALGIPLAVLVVVHYRIRRLRAGEVAAGALCLAGLAALFTAFRGTGSVSDPIAAAGALSLTLDGFYYLVNAIARIDDFLWGATLWEDLTLTYFPRALWDGKPVVYGFLSAQESIVPGLYEDTHREATFPPGIVAEGYVNFGVFGAVLLPLLGAAVLRAVYLCLERGRSAFYLLLMGWLLANLVNLFRGLGFILPQLLITAAFLSPILWGPAAVRGRLLPTRVRGLARGP
jgi:hypothetical protein